MIWYENNNNDIVISTRIRLARNISGIPFPNALANKTELTKKIKSAITDSGSTLSGDFEFIGLDKLNDAKRQALSEEHLISREMLIGDGKSAMISSDKTMSIMLMEEDHIRLQIIKSGLCLDEAYNIADKVDDVLEESLEFAFDEEWGYLTACPTNAGTGMRASVMMHLPALGITGNIQKVIASANNIGITVRGLYGEGSKSYGNMYQISNSVSEGASEKEIIDKLKNIVNQITELEKNARDRIKDDTDVADKLYRSYGTLKYARKISSNEAKALLSDVLLGKNMGIISESGKILPLELMVKSEPALLSGSKKLGPDERDLKRAELIRNNI